jgi:SAM-dependent methyltransferase
MPQEGSTMDLTDNNASGIASSIHPNDYIFHHLLHVTQDHDKATAEYLEKGFETAVWFKMLVAETRPLTEPFTFLDFASGYGRVTRHLPKLMPSARIVGCDIHPDAIAFLNGLGIEAFLSSATPDQFAAKGQFDVIIALSFFTHMPERTWARWLCSLIEGLTPNGSLIFSTHGYPALDFNNKILSEPLTPDEEGFAFTNVSEQRDLDIAEYGTTITAFSYVYTQIIRANAELVRFQEAGAGYQDLYILQRQRRDRSKKYAGGAESLRAMNAALLASTSESQAMRVERDALGGQLAEAHTQISSLGSQLAEAQSYASNVENRLHEQHAHSERLQASLDHYRARSLRGVLRRLRGRL